MIVEARILSLDTFAQLSKPVLVCYSILQEKTIDYELESQRNKEREIKIYETCEAHPFHRLHPTYPRIKE